MPIKKRFLRNDKLPETDNSIKPRNFFPGPDLTSRRGQPRESF